MKDYWFIVWIVAGITGWTIGGAIMDKVQAASKAPIYATAAPGISVYEIADNCVYVIGGQNGIAMAAVKKAGSAGRCQ